jgi:DNA-binding NtrC family response regulator
VPAENILVVDDDQAFLDLMAHHLRRKGHNVECALDGKEALHALQSKGPFYVLVTDLMMPGMSGLELLRLARKIDPNIEVIVITAAPSLEMAISAMREDGAFDYLTKPLDMMSELSLAVERAAEQSRAMTSSGIGLRTIKRKTLMCHKCRSHCLISFHSGAISVALNRQM